MIRELDQNIGVAVARRTVFRAGDDENWGNVASRVAAGNIAVARGRDAHNTFQRNLDIEEPLLSEMIARGAMITSGRHLQQGDVDQPNRTIEVFTNCSTAITSFAIFYLLLNGSGVGASYDDDLRVVDYSYAPRLRICLSTDHDDYPKDRQQWFEYGKDFHLVPWAMTSAEYDEATHHIVVNAYHDMFEDSPRVSTLDENDAGHTSEVEGTVYHRVGDSREGWSKAMELYESMTLDRDNRQLILDFSDVRPRGAPIAGMQDRPASGPLSVMRAFHNIRDHVVAKAQDGLMEPWEQAMRVDHMLSVEVQVGGARRAARMSTKSWRDPEIFTFIRIKSEGGLWTSNNSVMVDKEFWGYVAQAITLQRDYPDDWLDYMESDLARHAWSVFSEATRCSYINGEPGFINADKLEDHRTGFSRERPIYENGEDFGNSKYEVTFGKRLLRDTSLRASKTLYPVITNPCGEIPLDVRGGYCVIGDVAPLFAYRGDIEKLVGRRSTISPMILEQWDFETERAVRLMTRFLMRVNLMDALYGKEVERTNRIGVSLTGIHEYAWVRFGLGFRDLLDEETSWRFWNAIKRMSDAAKDEAKSYAETLNVKVPHTVMTIKPSGSVSKLFGLSEGAHLPAMRQYIRWVQFKGAKNEDGTWTFDSDPLLPEYEKRGYPIRSNLRTFTGMSLVGFPTKPLISRLGMDSELVTAPEATPTEQYRWLRLLEKYWIGEKAGGQISYTLKVYTDQHGLDDYRKIVSENQPTIRVCSVMPSRPDDQLGYEYTPEEPIDDDTFEEVMSRIVEIDAGEIDEEALKCASGACPI